MATAKTSKIQVVHRNFSSEKCVDPLNAANIFNVCAFLHGICKQGHRFEVVNSQEKSENKRLQYLTICTNFGWLLLSWNLAMCQIFCCSIIHSVSFNHQRNVRSRISVSHFQVSVSDFMTKSRSRSRLEIWARSRSRRLRSRLHHWHAHYAQAGSGTDRSRL